MRGIQLEGVAVQHAGRTIFRGLDWRIGERDRVGLIGPNGTGKSSLLRVIAGEREADAGRVTRPRGFSIGYLTQEIELTPGRTLLEEAHVLPPRLAEVQRELDGIEARLADPDVYGDERKLAHALARQEEALERFEKLGGGRHESRVRELLAQLGFGPEHAELPTETLSGGQKKLITLARLALDSPDVLLLDEPDNHLDLEAKQGLEAFIRGYDGAVVIVSHDRYLLDDTVDTHRRARRRPPHRLPGQLQRIRRRARSCAGCANRRLWTSTSRRRSRASRLRSSASSSGPASS